MKTEEFAAFRTFCAHADLINDDFEPPERPDFVAKDRSIGIELVGYHRDADNADRRGSGSRKAEAELAAVRELARSLCRSSQRVNVFFGVDSRRRVSG